VFIVHLRASAVGLQGSEVDHVGRAGSPKPLLQLRIGRYDLRVDVFDEVGQLLLACARIDHRGQRARLPRSKD
jgi:hypothetical protein